MPDPSVPPSTEVLSESGPSKSPDAPDKNGESAQAPAELKRELWAILLIYAVLTLLPLLTGFACEGSP